MDTTKFKVAIFLGYGFIMACIMTPVLLASQPAAASDAGICYNIGDADARTYCIARVRADAGQCYSIQRSDLRAQCLAEVRK